MQDMTSIKYSLCPDGQQYAAGKTNLKESIGHPLNTNGCTILICTSGSAIVSTNFQRQVMKKGDATILFYDIVFETIRVSESFSALYISLPNEAIESTMYKMTSISFWDFMYAYPICHTSEQQYELLYSWYQQTKWIIEEYNPEYRLSLLSNNFYNLLMGVENEVKKITVTMNDQVKKDRGWIILRKFAVLLSEYCHISRDVKFYADKLCITPDYLYKLTQKGMEMSPKGIIDQQIIIEIKTYLTNTDLSVKNIAAKLHFDDSSYMCRFFRRLTGFSPTEYRNKITS